MKILVLGGTGTVGSNLVRELLARDLEVKVLTRSKEKAARMPPSVQAEIGDLQSPDTIRRIFNDVDGVFLLNGNGPAEAQEGLMAVNGAMLAHVPRLVYLSAQGVDTAPHLPHFAVKLAVELAIRKSGISYTILRPNNFFQNDYHFKEPLLSSGVYPLPLGDRGVSRVDVRDIAEAAAVALTGGTGEGETYNLVGAEAYTGESTAEAWSRVLGWPIVYAGNDLDEWERQMLQFLPAWQVFNYRLMFDVFQKEGSLASDEDLDRQGQLLGREPRRFEDFARETAALWQAGQ